MQRRQLGNSALHITPIGFGAWAIGGGEWAYGWGEQDDAESIAAIRRACELGINWIDTAAVYGLGHSEEVVARAVRELPEKPYIFTKCSRIWNEQRELGGSLKPDSIRREVEDSLRRLQVETIDLYQIHWPDPDPDIVAGWETLAALQREGKLRYIGVSNFNAEQMERISSIAPITSLQPPYSLINRKVEAEILPYCAAHNIGVIAYSPMQSGLLAGRMTRERAAAFPANDWRSRNPEFQEPRLSRNLALAELLGQIGADHGRTAGDVAIAWTLHNPAVTGAIVGFRSAAQVEGLIHAGSLALSAAELAQIADWLQANP